MGFANSKRQLLISFELLYLKKIHSFYNININMNITYRGTPTYWGASCTWCFIKITFKQTLMLIIILAFKSLRSNLRTLLCIYFILNSFRFGPISKSPFTYKLYKVYEITVFTTLLNSHTSLCNNFNNLESSCFTRTPNF